MVIKFSGEYFSVKDTLECGQIFRYTENNGKYFVVTADKACVAYNAGDYAYIECMDADGEYFKNFFDLDRDYSAIYNSALKENVPFLTAAAECGKGIRILNQNTEEALFSFIVSQNNNIPRIKKIIEALANNLGEEKELFGYKYHAFPTATELSERAESFYSSIGLGYRASYMKSVANAIVGGYSLDVLTALDTAELKKSLLTLRGVGPKVADCVSLFGFHRTDSFPVDTWIEKVYKEDFNGELTDRNKITEFFTDRFGENSGYVQQYVFHYKRNVEKYL